MSLPAENYVHPNDGRVTTIPGEGPDTSLPEREQDRNINDTYPSRPGAQDSIPAGLTSATGGLPSSGAANQGYIVAPQSATTTHGVSGTGYPTVGTAQSGDSVGRGLASTERSAGQDTALPAGQQDANIAGSFVSRPGATENTPMGVSSGVADSAVSNTAQIGAVTSATGESPSTTGSNTLSTREQDANIAASFASRPGAQDATPLGVSSDVDNSAVSSTAQIGAVSSATGEISQKVRPGEHGDVGPSTTGSNTLSANEQDANIAGTQAARPGPAMTPAGVSSSQSDALSKSGGAPSNDAASNTGVADTVKSTLDSVAERTTGTKSVTEQLPSAQSVANQLPTAQEAADSVARGVSSLLAGISNLAVGAKDTAAETAAMSHPESENARDASDLHIPGAFESETSDRDDLNAVKQSLPSTEQLTGSSRPLSEQARDTARSAQDRAQQVVNSAKEQLPGQSTTSSSSSGLNAPASAQAQVRSHTTIRNFSLPSGPTTTAQTAPTVTTGIASVEAPKVSGKDAPPARGMPDVVADSQKQAGEAAPLDLPAYSAEQETQKREALRRPDKDSTGSATAQSNNGSGIGGAIAGGLAAAGTAAVGAAQYAREKTHQATGTDPVSILPESAQKTINAQTTVSTNEDALQRCDVPQVVRDSQQAAGVGPEASGNPLAVQEKNEFESELRREVQPVPPSSDNNRATGVLAGGLAGVSADVPQVVRDSQQAAGVGPEASGNPLAVQEKSDVESELRREVQPAQPSSENSRATGVLAGGLAGVSAAAASASASAREKTQDVTGTDPVSLLPDTAQRSINQSMTTGAASEKSSATDVSYEHRPKTLPQSEIAARERERGLGEGATSVAQPNLGTSHGGPSLNDVDLHAGIKNTVVGAGSAHPLAIPQHGVGAAAVHRGSLDSKSRGPVAHIRDDLDHPDLSAGVKNGVIGAGSGSGSGAL